METFLMSTEHVVVDPLDGILQIRLNRPDKKNALNQAMYTALAEAFTRANSDPAVRVALLTGTPDCFCSGNDIQDFLNMPQASTDNPVLRFMLAMAGCAKPIVAAVNGPAVGVGTTLLLHCDLVYAGASARLHMPFVSIGICPEFAASYLLPRIMGHARAAELVLLAEPFGAQKALEYGLVNEVLPDDQYQARALDKARRLASLPPAALRSTKALLKRWNREEILRVIPAEFDTFMPMLKQPEALEAFSAFLQKRKPDFSRFQ
jgi:enoyl-CoA hydratase/carnithine racemase